MRREDQIVMLELVMRAAKAERARLTAEWLEDARPKQSDPAMAGESLLGVIRRVKGSESIKLVDPKALLEWAMAHAPHLVSYEPHISESNLSVLKRHPVDDKTGEMLPGFEVVTGEPKASVRLEPDALDLLQAEISKGSISFSEVLEIEQ